jgi:hypothetical protein
MPTKLFHGSCHCGKIKFQANIDLTKGSSKCNCTFCRKNSNWNVKVIPEDFKIIQGEEFFSKYENRPEMGYYVFCKHCGNMSFGISKKTEWTQDGASIKLSSLDDVSTEELNSSPISYYDGKANTWAIITDPEEIKTLY